MNPRQSIFTRHLTFLICTFMIFGLLFSGIIIQIPFAKANSLNHDVGKIHIDMLTDFGRVLQTVNWIPPRPLGTQLASVL